MIDSVDVDTISQMKRAKWPSVRADIPLPHGLSAETWAFRHAAGEVPDSGPHGLDRLASYGVSVRFRSRTSGRVAARIAQAVRHRTAGLELIEAVLDLRRQNDRATDVVLAYDERTGVPAALLASQQSSPPVVSGVGWLTTRVDTHPVSAILARRALPGAALVWAQCAPMLPVLAREWGIARSQLRFLPFGIDTDFYALQPAATRPDVVASAGADRFRDYDLLGTGGGRGAPASSQHHSRTGW